MPYMKLMAACFLLIGIAVIAGGASSLADAFRNPNFHQAERVTIEDPSCLDQGDDDRRKHPGWGLDWPHGGRRDFTVSRTAGSLTSRTHLQKHSAFVDPSTLKTL